jgi:hypothetical protein
LNQNLETRCRTIDQTFSNAERQQPPPTGEILVQVITSKDLDVIVSWDQTSSYAVSSPLDATGVSTIKVNVVNNYFKSNRTFSFRTLNFFIPDHISFFIRIYLFIYLDSGNTALFLIENGGVFTIDTCTFSPRTDLISTSYEFSIISISGMY